MNVLKRLEARLINIENLILESKSISPKAENKLYSVKELSKYSGLSQLSIRNYIKEGKIIAKKIGRRVLIEQSQFENGLEEIKSLKYKR